MNSKKFEELGTEIGSNNRYFRCSKYTLFLGSREPCYGLLIISLSCCSKHSKIQAEIPPNWKNENLFSILRPIHLRFTVSSNTELFVAKTVPLNWKFH